MEFTREQLEQVVVSGRITVHEPHGFCSFVPDIRNLASLAIAQLDKIEALELDAEDAREDIDALDQRVVKLRAKLESAEAERDILQWASDNSGGKGEWESEPEGGLGKVRSDLEDLTETVLPRMMDLIAEIKSCAEADEPDPYDASFEIETETDMGSVIREECPCGCGDRRTKLDAEPASYFAGELLTCDGRPHESLVWAMFYSETLSMDDADDMLEAWRARWPEPKA